MNRVILSLGFILSHMVGMAEPVYKRYDVNDGLPGNNIYCAMQDRDGFMWFATDAGVSRFDGIHFVKFSMDEGLCDNEILRIVQDSQGRIWFLSLSGCLSYYLDGTITSSLSNENLEVELNTLGTVGMFEDSQHRLWFFGLDDDVVQYDGQSAKVFRADLNNYPSGIRTGLHVYEDKEGVVYFFNSHNVCRWNETGIEPSKSGPEFKHVKSRCFLNRGQGNALSIVDDGLFSLVNYTWTALASKENYPRLDAAAALFDMDDGHIAIIYGAQQGIEYAFQGMSGELTGEIYFDNEVINYACSDTDRNLWFCSAEHGVYCITNEDRGNAKIPLLNSVEPVCIARLNENALCVGAQEGQLYSIDLFANQSRNLAPLFAGKSINRIAADEAGNIWFGGDKGLFRWRNSDGHISEFPIENQVYDIKDMVMGNDNRLYVAILNGIFVADPKEANPKLIRLDAVPRNRVYTICPTADGRLWFENNNRLYYTWHGELHEITEFKKFAKGRISCIAESPGGILAVATIGSGIVFLKGTEIIGSLTRSGGLDSDECRKVRWSGNTCWVITSVGVTSFDYNNNSVDQIKNYTSTDGLPSGRIHDLYPTEESVFILSGSGLYKISTGSSRHESNPPPMRLLAITSDGQVLDPEQELHVYYNANLRVAYIGITFSFPREVEYQYKLDDSENWTTTKDRSLEFSALSWGEHVLQIRAHKYNSPWSETESLQFSITPPFYGTWWFRGFLLLILSSFVFGIVRFMLRRRYRKQLAILEQEQLVLEERNRISTDLHDDLGAELSNIVILSRIARSKMNNKQDATEPVLKIDTAANDIINKMSGIIWSLNPSNDYLDNLMDYLRKYSQEFIELHNLDGAVIMSGAPRHRVVKGMLRRNVFLILKEALQNVYKHSKASRVDIQILLEEDKMILSIKDNGEGFNREEKKGFGLGLNSMKRRASEVGGILNIESAEGEGTSVVLQFPV